MHNIWLVKKYIEDSILEIQTFQYLITKVQLVMYFKKISGTSHSVLESLKACISKQELLYIKKILKTFENYWNFL